MICPKCFQNTFHPEPIDEATNEPEPWYVDAYIAIYYCVCSNCGYYKDIPLMVAQDAEAV